MTISFGQIDYDTQIQPIFNNNCNNCHWGGGGYTGSGLDLQSYDLLMEGGISGNVIESGLLELYITTGLMPYDYGKENS